MTNRNCFIAAGILVRSVCAHEVRLGIELLRFAPESSSPFHSLFMQDYTPFAFSKIDSDLQFLISCFREVLADMGQDGLAAALPWDEIPVPGEVPPRMA